MQKVSDDSTATTVSKSTFTVQFEKVFNRGRIYTPAYGPGWRFAILLGQQIGTTKNSKLGKLKASSFSSTVDRIQTQIFFDPYLMSHAKFHSIATQVCLNSNASEIQTQDLAPQLDRDCEAVYLETCIASYIDVIYPLSLEITMTTASLSIAQILPTSSKLQCMINNTLTGDDFIDAKFYLFSCRNRNSGRVSRPRELFVNSFLLRGHSSYLDALLCGEGFKESHLVDFDSYILSDLSTNDYDYELDSDLESIVEDEFDDSSALVESETELHSGPSRALTPSVGVPFAQSKSPSAVDQNFLEPSNLIADVVCDKGTAISFPRTQLLSPKTSNALTIGLSSKVSSSPTAKSMTILKDLSEPSLSSINTGISDDIDNIAIRLPPSVSTILEDNRNRQSKRGRVVVVKDDAFTTWKALVWYLYTGDIVFSRLKSDQSGSSNVSISQCTPCSPKSMYRLADKIGLEDLKERAFTAIRSSVSVDNIVEEFFSDFTSWYPEVREFEMAFLLENYTTAVARRVSEQVKGIVESQSIRRGDLLASLLHKLGRD